jgi:hypothetical protein
MPVELRAEARDDLIAGALFYDRQRESLGSHFIECLTRDGPIRPGGAEHPPESP